MPSPTSKITLTLAVFLLCSCEATQEDSKCKDLNELGSRVPLDMSMQLLRIEVARDQVRDTGLNGLRGCDSRESSKVYDEVRRELRKLMSCAGTNEEDQLLKEIDSEWTRLQNLQALRWRQAQQPPAITDEEKCLRPSDVSGVRISIEHDWQKIWAKRID
jgi:hypothetical protein